MERNMANQVVWFDIPVVDLDRAIWFYSAVLGATVKKGEFPGMAIGVLPHEDNEISECPYKKEGIHRIRAHCCI
jgi:predicted enzyme related to lactoylglutathione lyase